MTRREQVLRAFGDRPSRDSRRLMAARIVELEQRLDLVRSVKRSVLDTGFGSATVVFAHDLDRALEGKP